jgi:hypothetical protein
MHSPAPRSAIRRSRRPSWNRLPILGTALATALSLSLGGWMAHADTRPSAASVPATVSSDPLPTAQIDGVVWTQLIVGKTVFAGGEFTTARPAGAAPGKSAVKRSNFVAYNILTGRLRKFAPQFNGQVRALAVSPDGRRLYVGGSFTKVNGVTRNRLAAFDLTTFKLLTSFKPNVNSKVYGLATTKTRVYAAGMFTSVSGLARRNVAALNAKTGAVYAFSVRPAGGIVRQIVISPDGRKAMLGGSFTSMNGSSNPGYGLAAFRISGSQPLPMQVNKVVRNANANSAIMSLAAAKDGFYGSGYNVAAARQGNLEGSFKADWNGNLIWLEDCHGDTYSIAPARSGAVYVAGHPHNCVGLGAFPNADPVVNHRGLAFTQARTGTITGQLGDGHDFRGQPAPALLDWYPDISSGTYTGQSQGPWSVAASKNYVVYGGEFTTVNGKAQQGLVRFAKPHLAPNDDGPRVRGAGFRLARGAATPGKSTVNLTWRANWDRDNATLTYRVYRDGIRIGSITRRSTFWQRPALAFSDAGAKRGKRYRYHVTVRDPFGNQASSSVLTVNT